MKFVTFIAFLAAIFSGLAFLYRYLEFDKCDGVLGTVFTLSVIYLFVFGDIED